MRLPTRAIPISSEWTADMHSINNPQWRSSRLIHEPHADVLPWIPHKSTQEMLLICHSQPHPSPFSYPWQVALWLGTPDPNSRFQSVTGCPDPPGHSSWTIFSITFCVKFTRPQRTYGFCYWKAFYKLSRVKIKWFPHSCNDANTEKSLWLGSGTSFSEKVYFPL